MKTLSIVSIAFSATLLVSSCDKQTDDPVTPPEPSRPEKMEILISPSVTASRATDYGFESGDRIGLYVVNYKGTTPGSLADTGNHVDNMRFTYSGTWTPDIPIYWADNENHADFYLYYPYTTVTSVNAHQFDVKADQSTEAAYKASDMMIGKAVNVAPTTAATLIPVDHVMSRIIIDLKPGNGFTAQSLAAASVAVKVNGVKCGATVDLATGKVTAAGSATSVTPFFTDGVYKALIVPQSVSEGNLITVTVDGRDFNLRKAFTFASATSHKFTVTLSKTSNGINVSINQWNDDGSDNGGTAE